VSQFKLAKPTRNAGCQLINNISLMKRKTHLFPNGLYNCFQWQKCHKLLYLLDWFA